MSADTCHREFISATCTRWPVGSEAARPYGQVATQELVECVAWAHQAGIRRFIINGSFVTSKLEPNDVDLVLLPGPDYPRGQPPAGEMIWPFLQVQVAVDEEDLESWAFVVFGTDRQSQPKGVVEIEL